MGCTFLEGSAADILCSRRRENDAVFIEDTAQFLKDIPCGLARGPGSLQFVQKVLKFLRIKRRLQ
jgi:hypothetical protein